MLAVVGVLFEKGETVKNLWSKLPGWGKWVIGIVGGLILLGIGGAIGSNNEGDLKSEVSMLEAQLASVEEERGQAEDKASRIEGLKGKIVGEAQSRASAILSGAKRESEEAKESLGSLKSEVASTENELEGVESSLSGAREKKAKSTIPGDGTFKAEVDYIPGTYRAPGGSNCYWATLNSADPYDIASNENATGPTIASIESPYFQTQGCGRWERISE